jgi:2-polyprenyl-3-methyl-5-hydroxy-6-metoxy-1,4-benzoquinol methylase
VAFKLLMDPVYAAAAEQLDSSELPLIDIGCGMSLLAHYLHDRDQLPRYLGFDHDRRKIEAGKAAASRGGLPERLELHCRGAATLKGVRGNVALLDVLHYLPREQQALVLQVAADRVAPGGQLIMRNVVREPNWRFHATVMEEHVLRATGWMRVGAQYYPTAAEIRAPLEAAGLIVHMRPLRGRTPFNSFLITARRIALASDRAA